MRVSGFEPGDALAAEIRHSERTVPVVVISESPDGLALPGLDGALAYDLRGSRTWWWLTVTPAGGLPTTWALGFPASAGLSVSTGHASRLQRALFVTLFGLLFGFAPKRPTRLPFSTGFGGNSEPPS